MPRVAMRGITKRFGPVLANDHIDLTIARGGIHAIVGENGAGKTTLMRILFGMLQPDAGTIELDGRPTRIGSPAVALALGIGMVHQHFQLVDQLSVVENLVLGKEPNRFGVVFDRRRSLERAQQIAAELGARLPWDAPVGLLSIAERQRLEIMRLLHREADIFIFDEPTSALAPQEAEDLFQVLSRLAVAGHTIIFISHKLREVLQIASTITVMRRGRVVITLPTADVDINELATLMVGEAIERVRTPSRLAPGEAVLDVVSLTVADELGIIRLSDATFTVSTGEVLGIAGVTGSGQQQLVEALVGLRRPIGGHIRLFGRDVTQASAQWRRRHGLGYISADRESEGACLSATIRDNAIVIRYRDFTGLGWMKPQAIARFLTWLINRFDIRGAIPNAPASTLSGGNLQRLVVGRELERHPKVLIAANPTRGVDVRGRELIHQWLLDERSAGAGILLISEDLTELLELADRILVFFNGHIVGGVLAREATLERLGALMTGVAA